MQHLLSSSSGSPESRTQRYAVISRVWATGPRLPSGRDGRTRTCVCVSPKHVGLPLPYIPLFQSERAESNRRSPGPQPGAIPSPSLRSDCSGSCRSRTGLHALKGRDPQTDRRTSHRERAPRAQLKRMASAHLPRSGSGGARIRVSWFSARRYTISATDPTKKARCLCDTGLSVFFGNRYGLVSQAQWIGRGIRRLIGEPACPSSLCATQPYRSHGSFSKRAARRGLPTGILSYRRHRS